MNAGMAGLSDEAIEQAERFLVGRGWDLADVDDEGLAAVYPASLRGADPNSPRLSFLDIGISRLFCIVTPQMIAEIDPCGVINGCRSHRSGPLVRIPWNDRDHVETTLGRHERHARTLDRASLAECLIFGECSTRNFTLENP